MPASLTPVVYALGGAFFFGLMPIFMNRGVVQIGAQAGAMITIGTAAALYTLATPLWMRPEYFASPALWVFLANGLIHPTASTRARVFDDTLNSLIQRPLVPPQRSCQSRRRYKHGAPLFASKPPARSGNAS